jgi:Tol biopolymer transport system component
MTIPRQLNHYTILEPLGQGGMGEVYVAEDTKLHRKVAVKVLSDLAPGDPERRTRFEREARAVAALNHPSIVTIHSVEEAEGVPFLTMELVEGRPLSDLIASAATADGVPLDALLRIGIGVSDAMAAAHQRGITHRDLKPANIMVTEDGRVKVLDFGLAKLREAELESDGVTRLPNDLTGEGRIIGTVAYMSPEQAEGKPVDQRSDIFSLGVVLHEMATGERPFKGDTNVSVMSSILKDTPSSIDEINPKLPAGLAKVIRRSLAKDPSRRYQTATDLRIDLEDLKQELERARTTSLAAARPAVRTRSYWSLVAAVAVVALVSAGAFGVWRWRANQSSGAAAFELDRFTRLTSTGHAQIAAISPDGRYVVHIKNEGVRPGLWVRQTATMSDVQIVPPADVRYDGLTFAPDGNFVYYVTYERSGGVASLYKIPVLGGLPQRVLEDIDSRIAFSPDALQIAFLRGSPASGRNYLMVAKSDGSEVRQLSVLPPPDQFQLNAPSWSPDGRTIIAAVQSLRDGPHSAVFAVDSRSGDARNIGGRWGFAHDVDWMPDGRSFILSAVPFGDQAPQLWQVMFPGGERRRVTNDLNAYIGVSIAADGRSVATVQAENNSSIWVVPTTEPATAAEVTTGRGRADGLSGLTWTPDGRIVFGSSASGRQELWIMNADGSNARQLTNSAEPPLNPTVTGDGRFIVFQKIHREGIYLHRMGLEGSNARQLTKIGTELQPVASPDGQSVFFNTFTSGQPRPFKVSIDGGDPVSLGQVYFRPTDVSPDGATLLGVGWDEVNRRSTVATLPAGGGTPVLLPLPVFNGPEWSADGGAIVHVNEKDSVRNLWARDVSGGQPRQLTRFPPGNIHRFAQSMDGRRLAVARGAPSSDVVLLTRRQ